MPFKTLRNLHVAPISLRLSAKFLQSAVLVAAFGVLLAVAIFPLVGTWTIAIALLAVVGIVFLALLLPPWTAMWIYGGRPSEPGLSQSDRLIDELSERTQLPRPPDLYVIPSTLLSAFSVGTPDRSAIAVTEGLLRQLTMREIAAVLAREISHISRGDLPALAMADITSRFAQALYYLGLVLAALNVFRLLTRDELISWWAIALLVLAPALLNLMQLALPRAREFVADQDASFLTGDPMGLASAISRIEISTGSLFDDLMPPVPGRKVPLPSLLRYPPPAEQRITRLRTINVPPAPPLDVSEGPRISLVGVGPIQMRPRYRWSGVWF